MKLKLWIFYFTTFGLGCAAWGASPNNSILDLNQQYEKELFENNDPAAIEALNSKALQEIRDFRYEKSRSRAAWISYDQASQIFQSMINHPVIGWNQRELYDPAGNYGFCFGRALYVHLELLRRGVQKEAIKKVFAVGPMTSLNVNWQFHVATMVKGPNDVWWVIDTYFFDVVRLEDWFREMKKNSQNQKLRMYISEPNRIGPAGWSYNISPGGLFSYNNYFQDLFRYFKNNPIPPSQKFQTPYSPY